MNESKQRVFSGIRPIGDIHIGCFECKKVLAEGVETKLSPIRERATELRAHPERVLRALTSGASRRRGIARETMIEVRNAMGIDVRALDGFSK